MYQMDCLSLEEARKAADAALVEASKREPFFPIAVAVTDLHGDLIYFARMDGTSANAGRMAINKAYSAAMFRMSSGGLHEFMREYNWTIGTWGDSKFTDTHGGLLITKKDGTALAAIGVGGVRIGGSRGDEEVALVAAKALDLPGK